MANLEDFSTKKFDRSVQFYETESEEPRLQTIAQVLNLLVLYQYDTRVINSVYNELINSPEEQLDRQILETLNFIFGEDFVIAVEPGFDVATTVKNAASRLPFLVKINEESEKTRYAIFLKNNGEILEITSPTEASFSSNDACTYDIHTGFLILKPLPRKEEDKDTIIQTLSQEYPINQLTPKQAKQHLEAIHKAENFISDVQKLYKNITFVLFHKEN